MEVQEHLFKSWHGFDVLWIEPSRPVQRTEDQWLVESNYVTCILPALLASTGHLEVCLRHGIIGVDRDGA